MAGTEKLVGEVVDDRYEIEALLGRGGMGAVYRARHVVTGRRVAIKWLHEEDEQRRTRFLREARAMARVDHPNVVPVHDVGSHGRAIYFVMDLLRGETLRGFVKKGGISAEEAIARLMPALVGVEAAHRAGVLHRDLKPDNLFVCCDRDGTPYDTRVLDFGVAKLQEEHQSLTLTGAVVGTPKYMAPEQVREEDLDERADLFSLGLMLYELLVGRVPYKAQAINALLIEIGAGVPDVRDHGVEIADDLADVVNRAVAVVREDRYDSVAAFARALEGFAAEEVRFQEPRDAHRASIPMETLREITPEITETRVERRRKDDEGLAATQSLELPPRRPRYSFVQFAVLMLLVTAVSLIVWASQREEVETEVMGEVGVEVEAEAEAGPETGAEAGAGTGRETGAEDVA